MMSYRWGPEIIMKVESPKSLQRYSVTRVCQILRLLNERKPDPTLPWLETEKNPFRGLQVGVIQNVLEEFKQFDILRKELFQMVACKPLRNMDVLCLGMKEPDVVDVLKWMKSTQTKLEGFKFSSMTDINLMKCNSKPLAVSYLKEYIQSLPLLTYIDIVVVEKCLDGIVDIIGANCPNLIVLKADGSGLTNQGLKNLCMTTGNSEDHLRRCQNLQELHLDMPFTGQYTNLVEGIKTVLLNLPNLQIITCSSLERALIELHDEMRELPKFNLRKIEYNGTSGEFFNSVPSSLPRLPSVVAKTCPRATHLEIRNPSKEELQRFQYMENVRTVSLRHYYEFPSFNDGCNDFLKRVGKDLEELTIIGVDDIDLMFIDKHCSKLKCLTCLPKYAYRKNVTPDTLLFKNLEYLRIQSQYHTAMSPKEFVHFISQLHRLRCLKVSGCVDLGRQHLKAILMNNPLTDLQEVQLMAKGLWLTGARSAWEKICA